MKLIKLKTLFKEKKNYLLVQNTCIHTWIKILHTIKCQVIERRRSKGSTGAGLYLICTFIRVVPVIGSLLITFWPISTPFGTFLTKVKIASIVTLFEWESRRAAPPPSHVSVRSPLQVDTFYEIHLAFKFWLNNERLNHWETKFWLRD